MLNIYQEQGYNHREDYLESLAEEYRLPVDVVFTIANMLGEEEDFDGLISMLRDAEGMFDN